MVATLPTVIAVDWSGARRTQRRRIWLAEVRADRSVRLECGRTREELVAHLVQLARHDPNLVVGLGFAFSFPRWFLRRVGARAVDQLWELVRRRGESWLSGCPAPFWGLPHRPRPPGDPTRPAFRRTESVRLPQAGIGPKSVFQLGGAGSVGTTSLRGMPFLAQLRGAGFSIAPFDPPRPPTVVEIYPRYLTGRVVKSSRSARALYLAQHFPDLPVPHWRRSTDSEDAFDALVSACCMADHRPTILDMPAPDPVERLEGRIWFPPVDPFHPATWPALEQASESRYRRAPCEAWSACRSASTT